MLFTEEFFGWNAIRDRISDYWKNKLRHESRQITTSFQKTGEGGSIKVCCGTDCVYSFVLLRSDENTVQWANTVLNAKYQNKGWGLELHAIKLNFIVEYGVNDVLFNTCTTREDNKRQNRLLQFFGWMPVATSQRKHTHTHGYKFWIRVNESNSNLRRVIERIQRGQTPNEENY